MLSGQLYYSNDYRELISYQNSQKFSLVAIDDDRSKYEVVNTTTGARELARDVSILSVLLPPYEVIDSIIETGNIEMAEYQYREFLDSDYDANRAMGGICLALIYGKNIVLFAPPEDDVPFDYIKVLCSYMAERFGVFAGNMMYQIQSVCNPNAEQFIQIIDLCYLIELITFKQYIYLYDPWTLKIPPSDPVCDKITIEELHRPVIPPSYEKSQYIMGAIANFRMVSNNKDPSLESPFEF